MLLLEGRNGRRVLDVLDEGRAAVQLDEVQIPQVNRQSLFAEDLAEDRDQVDEEGLLSNVRVRLQNERPQLERVDFAEGRLLAHELLTLSVRAQSLVEFLGVEGRDQELGLQSEGGRVHGRLVVQDSLAQFRPLVDVLRIQVPRVIWVPASALLEQVHQLLRVVVVNLFQVLRFRNVQNFIDELDIVEQFRSGKAPVPARNLLFGLGAWISGHSHVSPLLGRRHRPGPRLLFFQLRLSLFLEILHCGLSLGPFARRLPVLPLISFSL